MNTITRRTALAVPVTLPLLPVSAYAAPADPAVRRFREWRAANSAYERSFAGVYLDSLKDMEPDDPRRA